MIGFNGVIIILILILRFLLLEKINLHSNYIWRDCQLQLRRRPLSQRRKEDSDRGSEEARLTSLLQSR